MNDGKNNGAKNLVSVIIPCYNAEKCIDKCLKSVLSQTYSNLEIITINDASKDKTLVKLQDYGKRDDRIVVLNNEKNVGVDVSRFRGIAAAHGDYLCFVDADDWLSGTAIEKLLKCAARTNADVVEGRLTRVLGKYALIKSSYAGEYKEISIPELFDDYFISFFGKNILSVILCGKLYRKQLFDNPDLKPSGFKMGEDLLLNMRIFPTISKYVIIEDNVYFYRYGGGTSRYNPNLYRDLKAQYYIKLATIKKYSYDKALPGTKIEMCNVLHSQIVQMLVYNYPYNEVKAFFDREVASGFVDEITKDVDYRLDYYPFLKRKDLDGIIATDRNAIRKGRIMKYVKMALNKLL